MSVSLSSQEKLALAMTTARSMRDLARFMGISHQKLGRWLREGESGGVKSIPNDPETRRLIDDAFQAHSEVAKEQAEAEGLPFDPEVPVFAHRGVLRKGGLGDRVVIDHAQFIRKDLRDAVFVFLHETQRYYTLSVRSVVELALYLKQADERVRRRKRERTQWEEIAAIQLEQSLELGHELRPIYTKIEGFGPRTETYKAVTAVQNKLKQKHESATGAKGTAFADQYLLQLIPQNYVGFTRPPKAKGRTSKARGKAKK